MKGNRFETATFVLIFAGVGCFLLSLIAMGVAPWTTLKNVTGAANNSFMNPYYDDQGELNAIGRGRKTYIKEACWHCHSQFVRPVAGEPYRYGPPSQSFESMYDIPQTFGTRRVGPDLSREAGRRTDDWHLAHFYNPRHTVPESIMPGYPWLFEETPEGIKPKQEALDLVAYMQNLGKTYKDQVQAIVYPKVFKVSGAPEPSAVNLMRGEELFKQNCTGCHGAGGAGDGPALFLKPKPANLVDRYISPSESYAVLNRGVLGSSMPSFREMPERDLWAIAIYVSQLGVKNKSSFTKSTNESLIAKGQSLYQMQCLACHGSGGAGDGPAAVALNPRPKDFTRRIFSRDLFDEIMTHGIPGSGMPPFAHVQGEDRKALFEYIGTLFEESL